MTTRSLRRLGLPRPAHVEVGSDGLPLAVDGRAVEAVRARWVVEEGWWTERPVRRRYLEAVVAGGRLVEVFEDLADGRWYAQRG